MILEKYNLPTGFLFTGEYSRGKLETLSIGDYGKKANVKADFLGYTTEINGVDDNQPIMPLSEKWVITLSTQYGCPLKCNFCMVPNIPFNGNASFSDLKQQFYHALSLYPHVRYTDRLNIHFARMGEPSFNNDVMVFAKWLSRCKFDLQNDFNLRVETIHPVFTTSLPKKLKNLHGVINLWAEIKNNDFNGQAGLQFSINTTDDNQRVQLFGGEQYTLAEIGKLLKILPPPIGRKYCLNFAYASDSIVDADLLREHFDPENFMVKITPIHNNSVCREKGIETIDGYHSYTPYRDVETRLKKAGFDVLVFIPSMDEEKGLITCGNAILAGSKLE